MTRIRWVQASAVPYAPEQFEAVAQPPPCTVRLVWSQTRPQNPLSLGVHWKSRNRTGQSRHHPRSIALRIVSHPPLSWSLGSCIDHDDVSSVPPFFAAYGLSVAAATRAPRLGLSARRRRQQDSRRVLILGSCGNFPYPVGLPPQCLPCQVTMDGISLRFYGRCPGDMGHLIALTHSVPPASRVQADTLSTLRCTSTEAPSRSYHTFSPICGNKSVQASCSSSLETSRSPHFLKSLMWRR